MRTKTIAMAVIVAASAALLARIIRLVSIKGPQDLL
jgi:hypothetical protein